MLVPFLFFALAGTSTITLFDLKTQQDLILEEERGLLEEQLKDINDRLNQIKEESLSIAVSVSENPEVGRLLAAGDRQALIRLLHPSYKRLKELSGVSRLAFYIPPENFFMVLHESGQPVGITSNKKTVSYAMSDGSSSSCLEKYGAGLYIIGVTPVYYNGIIAGCIEIGISIDESFIDDYYAPRKTNASLYDIEVSGSYRLIAFSGDEPAELLHEIYPDKIINDSPEIFIAPKGFPGRSIIIGPLKDCSGKPVALIELDTDRSQILNRSVRIGKILVIIAVIGIAVSFLIAFFIISYLTKPIREIAKEAQDIAVGKREVRLAQRPVDEIGLLTSALNSMLDSLKKKQIKIEEYARDLETLVKERTAELIESEEKYRTLVENAPLIVYRVARDGTTEFINSYLTENTGYTVEDALKDRRFWRDKIAGIDQKAFETINKTCFHKGKPCRIESRVLAKDGRMLTFITHAIPAMDPDGNVKYIDGIMLDITELKRLQERAIQTEGIRTIGEISARMAHEIRNPLSAAGGFAHRLKEALKNDETNRKMAGIIVEEVAKLENFVRILLSSIEPIDLSLSETDINNLLLSRIKKLDLLLNQKGIRIINDFETDMPEIMADHERLGQALENIIKHAIISTPDGENIFVSTYWLKDQILLTLTHMADRITASDMDRFFFPHIEDEMDKSLLDLPLSKIIVQRHGGKIDLIREEGDILIMKIKFPIPRLNDADD